MVTTSNHREDSLVILWLFHIQLKCEKQLNKEHEGGHLSSIILAIVVAFTFIYLAVSNEEREIARQEARVRKRDMSF